MVPLTVNNSSLYADPPNLAASALNSELDADLNFQYFDHELNGLDENQLEAWRNSNNCWTGYPTLNADTDQNLLEIEGVVDRSSLWTLNLPRSILPVELINFTATKEEENRVAIQWQTGSELNSE